MKNFHIPRTMEAGSWRYDCDPIQHFPQSRTEHAAGVVLAIVIGILLAASAAHWYAS
jgi:hypothetical protein